MTAAAMIDALVADAAAGDRAGKMDLYGWLIGSWTLDVTRYHDAGSRRRRPGEWHFGWILEGRAIQDVWIVPRRGELRQGDAAANVNSYGTTLRISDPQIDAWQSQWIDPVARNFLAMVGRKQGEDIVQLGNNHDGRRIRWSFYISRKTPFAGVARPRVTTAQLVRQTGVSISNSSPGELHRLIVHDSDSDAHGR